MRTGERTAASDALHLSRFVLVEVHAQPELAMFAGAEREDVAGSSNDECVLGSARHLFAVLQLCGC